MAILTIKGNKFLGCTSYPECKNTRSFSIGVKCPEEGCGGNVVERRTRNGKLFYGCGRYPDCKFASWDKPVEQKCTQCGGNYLVQKVSKRKGTLLRCPACRAEFGENGALLTPGKPVSADKPALTVKKKSPAKKAASVVNKTAATTADKPAPAADKPVAAVKKAAADKPAPAAETPTATVKKAAVKRVFKKKYVKK
jgi:hypothetical protein